MKFTKIKNIRVWAGVSILIFIEQMIKILVNAFFLNKSIPILPPVLYFDPVFNRQYSWINSLFDLGIGKWMHIAATAALTLIVLLFYIYLAGTYGTDKMVDAMFAFVIAGSFCSLIDKVFWDGSLDYILVNGLFTFDLKDVYINTFIGLLLLAVMRKNEILKHIDDKDFMKGFFKFMFRRS